MLVRLFFSSRQLSSLVILYFLLVQSWLFLLVAVNPLSFWSRNVFRHLNPIYPDWFPGGGESYLFVIQTNLKHLVRFWKALGLCFNNQQKNGKFAKMQIFIAKSSYQGKNAQKKLRKFQRIIHSWKALDPANSNLQNICRSF